METRIVSEASRNMTGIGSMEPSAELKAWAAGIFEGEGSALIERIKPGAYQIVVAVSNTDKKITDPIREVWGGHYRANQDHSKLYSISYRRDYSIYFSRDEAKRFLLDILPHLKAKRDDVIVVLRALCAVPGEAALSSIGRKKAAKGLSSCLEPYYKELLELRRIRQ